MHKGRLAKAGRVQTLLDLENLSWAIFLTSITLLNRKGKSMEIWRGRPEEDKQILSATRHLPLCILSIFRKKYKQCMSDFSHPSSSIIFPIPGSMSGGNILPPKTLLVTTHS